MPSSFDPPIDRDKLEAAAFAAVQKQHKEEAARRKISFIESLGHLPWEEQLDTIGEIMEIGIAEHIRHQEGRISELETDEEDAIGRAELSDYYLGLLQRAYDLLLSNNHSAIASWQADLEELQRKNWDPSWVIKEPDTK